MRCTIAALIAGLALLGTPAAAQPRSLAIGVGGAFSSMDPHYFNLGPNNVLTTYVFEPLVRFNPQFQPEPSLAESWKAIDATTWEFKLRPGVTFTDGTKFTADDVVFTFGRIPTVLNSPSSFNFAVKPVSQIEVVDERTIRLHTAVPSPLLPFNMCTVRIVSRRHGEGAVTADYNSGKAAIGTGPFRVTEFLAGDHAVFQRNDGWWDKHPVWDTVRYRLIADNGARNAALQAGDVDVIDQVPTHDVADLRNNPKVSVVSAPGQRLIYLFADSGREQTPFVTDVAGGRLATNPLRDARVRHALSLAINRIGIRDHIMDGLAAPTGQLMPEGASGYDPAIKIDPYDPAAAKALLGEAGYPNGLALTLHGPNDRYVNDRGIVEAIAQMWTRIGVKTTVETMPAATFFPRAVRAEFSIRLTGWASDTGEASSPLTELLASSDPEKGRGAVLDPSHYGNPAVDAIVEQSLATIDTAAREALYRQAEELALADSAIIPIHHQVNIWAIRKGLVFHMRMQEGTRAWDIE